MFKVTSPFVTGPTSAGDSDALRSNTEFPSEVALCVGNQVEDRIDFAYFHHKNWASGFSATSTQHPSPTETKPIVEPSTSPIECFYLNMCNQSFHGAKALDGVRYIPWPLPSTVEERRARHLSIKLKHVFRSSP
jgi:hypothetical protein